MSLILNGTDGLSDVDGTAGTPAIRGTDANTGIFFPAANQLGLATNGTLGLIQDSAQNLGLASAPNLWNSTVKALQLNTTGTVFGGAGFASISQNYLYDTSNADVYVGNGFATQLLQRNGQFEFYTAPNNTSGALAAMTFTQRMVLTNGGILQFNSGFGSVANAYGVRAWVNFDGTGTPSIRASGNVSSITDFGAGDYGINFTTAMPDVSYASVGGVQKDDGNNDANIYVQVGGYVGRSQSTSATYARVARLDGFGAVDSPAVYVAVFR